MITLSTGAFVTIIAVAILGGATLGITIAACIAINHDNDGNDTFK